jgi:polyisoprenoid-binding protein YceI
MTLKRAIVVLLICCSTGMAQVKTLDAVKNESSVTYRMVHPLHKIEATSGDVHYKLDLDLAKKEIKAVSAAVDVTTFDSGNSNRDSHAMEVIDAISYPEASFTSTGVTPSGDSLTVSGKLTFHGITKDVVVKPSVQWSGNSLLVRGEFTVSLSAFNIERPSLLMIPVEDALTFSLVAAFRWE